ncbi:MAG: type I-U CRISPR-associated RAMP protein Csb1/Cas7u [Betaproteobacteria bacterium]
MPDLTLDLLRDAVAGTAAAFRCVTDYQPAGGPGDKVFPPTYERGEYAEEERVDPVTGEVIRCVLLDSVQSQANRMELALKDAMDAPDGPLLPMLQVEFGGTDLSKQITVTSLDAPHRVADAIFRDSLIDEGGTQVPFRNSKKGRILDESDLRNATGLFGLCPTALLFGLWDSTGPRGGLGAKFQRAIVSEIVGYGAVQGKKTASRIDPLQIMKESAAVYQTENGGWTLSEDLARRDKGKPVKVGKKGEGRPSDINHGNVPPSISGGGYTIRFARQTTVVSLPAVRRLRFPLPDSQGGTAFAEANLEARAVIVALGIAAATLLREQGADLRSRCQLVPSSIFVWELLRVPPDESSTYVVSGAQAQSLLNKAIAAAKAVGLPWEGKIDLKPSNDLLALVRASQKMAMAVGGED